MSHIDFAVSIGQEPVMPDSNKSLWQTVKQEPADKLNRRDRDGYDFIFLSIFGVKGYPVVAKSRDAAVGNGHPMGTSGHSLIQRHRQSDSADGNGLLAFDLRYVKRQ